MNQILSLKCMQKKANIKTRACRRSGKDLKKPCGNVHETDAVYIMINYEHTQKHEIIYKVCRSAQWLTYEPYNLHF